jgi:hypothetical protein
MLPLCRSFTARRYLREFKASRGSGEATRTRRRRQEQERPHPTKNEPPQVHGRQHTTTSHVRSAHETPPPAAYVNGRGGRGNRAFVPTTTATKEGKAAARKQKPLCSTREVDGARQHNTQSTHVKMHEAARLSTKQICAFLKSTGGEDRKTERRDRERKRETER